MPASKRTPLLAAQDRVHDYSPRVLSDIDLLTALLGVRGSSAPRAAAQQLLDVLPLTELAWSSPDALLQHSGIGPARAAAFAAAFELDRRGAWSPPRRGQRCLDPQRVYELMRFPAPTQRFRGPNMPQEAPRLSDRWSALRRRPRWGGAAPLVAVPAVST